MASPPPKKNDDKQPVIIIKRVKKGDAGHHGGAWKVAYADFVTAMMAFFLLLWLLSITTIEEKKQIAAYFSAFDPRPSKNLSGAGGVLGGTVLAPQGGMTMTHETVPPHDESEDDNEANLQNIKGGGDPEAMAQAQMDKQDDTGFQSSEASIRSAIEGLPDLKEAAKSVMIDQTPEGLRIQLVDQSGLPMFQIGSAAPLPHTVKLLGVVAGAIKKMPNKISVRGHTDARAYGKDATYTNWELSADRANTSRRVLVADGIDISRFENVQGKADSEPLDAAHPAADVNRRVSILILRQSLVHAAAKAKANYVPHTPSAPVTAPRAKENGVIYFP